MIIPFPWCSSYLDSLLLLLFATRLLIPRTLQRAEVPSRSPDDRILLFYVLTDFLLNNSSFSLPCFSTDLSNIKQEKQLFSSSYTISRLFYSTLKSKLLTDVYFIPKSWQPAMLEVVRNKKPLFFFLLLPLSSVVFPPRSPVRKFWWRDEPSLKTIRNTQKSTREVVTAGAF